jgi:hypothetical protein
MDMTASYETLLSCVALPLAMLVILTFGTLLWLAFVQKLLRR